MHNDRATVIKLCMRLQMYFDKIENQTEKRQKAVELFGIDASECLYLLTWFSPATSI